MAIVPQAPGSPNSKAEAQQDVFLREVDDALREDQLLGFMQRYGKPLAAAVVLGLGTFGGYLYWNHSQAQAAAERAERFTLALDRIESGALDAGAKDLEALAAEGDGGSRATAALMRAGVLQQQGKTAEAVKAFAAVAADSAVPQPYRELATVREVAASFDTLKPEQVITRLKPLAVPGNAWFGSAGEMVALAYLQQGQGDLAGPLLAAIAKDKAVPESIRSRTRQMAGMLGFDAIDDVARAAAGETQEAGAPQ